MDIVNFFEKVEGIWFSQRTTHFAPGLPSQTAQSTLHITRLTADDPCISSLCQQFSADPGQTVFALCIQQEAKASLYSATTSKAQSTTVLVGLKSDQTEQGAFFSQTEQEPATTGYYQLEDEVLMLTTETEEIISEERLWFMNPNLRLRTSLLKRADGFQMASFCSEVRRLPKK
ncbi:MAG: phycobiliprotein lyase [Leptolyngbya sp. SIO1D8]|nr:phycobiliprotein lyase [Leptolyngbya sp. SIO1D8]